MKFVMIYFLNMLRTFCITYKMQHWTFPQWHDVNMICCDRILIKWFRRLKAEEEEKIAGDFWSWQVRVGRWTSLRGFIGRICTTLTIVLGIWNTMFDKLKSFLKRGKHTLLWMCPRALHSCSFDNGGEHKRLPRRKLFFPAEWCKYTKAYRYTHILGNTLQHHYYFYQKELVTETKRTNNFIVVSAELNPPCDFQHLAY